MALLAVGLLLAVPPVAAQSPPNNANLSSLSVQGTGVAGFSPDTTTYTMNVPGSKAQVTVAATASHTNANVVITPADAALDGHQVDLSGGKNVITATVTAEDGATTKDYTVAITRAAVPHDWNLRLPDIETGSEFRVLIVTSTTRSATHGDISVYDAHVRSAVADGGHVDIRDYSQLFKALAGTKDGTTPKGHTGTNPNSAEPASKSGGSTDRGPPTTTPTSTTTTAGTTPTRREPRRAPPRPSRPTTAPLPLTVTTVCGQAPPRAVVAPSTSTWEPVEIKPASVFPSAEQLCGASGVTH